MNNPNQPPYPPVGQPLPNVCASPAPQPLPNAAAAPIPPYACQQPTGSCPAPPVYGTPGYRPAQYGVPAAYTAVPAGQPQTVPSPQPPVQMPMQTPAGPRYEKIDKRILRACRHKSELRWYWFLVILNILIIAGVVCYFIYAMDENRQYMDDVSAAYSEYLEIATTGETDDTDDSRPQSEPDQNKDEDSNGSMEQLQKEIDDMPENIEYLITILFLLIAIPFVVSYAYAQYRSMSIQITQKTYPEIYAIVQEFSQKLGLKKVPKVYLIQGNGILNAFSSFIPFKQYIELYADLVEVAYREHHDMPTLRFIIAHEMGHIYYKHATMHYYYSMLVSQTIPILGSTASRAREYSCDRLAQLLSGSDGIDAMMSLTAGIHLYKQVDKQDYIDHTVEVGGFFVFCYNLVSDHPVTCKRVIALADPQKRSGKLY